MNDFAAHATGVAASAALWLLLWTNGLPVDALIAGGIGIVATAVHRQRAPKFAIDDAGVHPGGRSGYSRSIPADEIVGWSIDHDRKRFAIHLRSGEARLLHLWGFPRAGRTAIPLALEEHGFPQIKVGDDGRAAIRRAQIREWKQAAPMIALAVLVALAAVAITRLLR